MKKKYYHITAVKNLQSILTNGLKANEEGLIYLFNNVSIQNECGDINTVADSIAHNQIFLRVDYAMLEINYEGLHSPLMIDEVAELTRNCQFFIKQLKIEVKHIDVFGVFECDYQIPNAKFFYSKALKDDYIK